MLKCGKTVICEKTMGLNLKHCRELLDIARENKIFLMEAIWTRCFPDYEILRKELDSGEVGDIVQVYATAGCSNAEVERMKSKDLGGESISDLDCYPLQFASFVFDARCPKDTAALGYINENGVDLSMGCVITFETGQTAILSTHTRSDFPNDAVIIGTKGSSSILVPYTVNNA
ncbi:hypothetical protein R5R35_010332 [Gryllus longicercus]|uniref:GFO/IDH/MocA-like oxidoreductase domain-containing protein n=2 Tax=Gryllus longicercus TaxID=2509291 RepID=A0AAN9ZE23_9ORTH